MIIENRIKEFEKLGFGMFVHFGLYSLLGRGEWALHHLRDDEKKISEYNAMAKTFNPKPDWADELARVARDAGAKYITITTRHHDGFSLYDTKGLSDFDAPHSAAGRDLIREFVDACRKYGIIPFFYHTLLDWYVPEYNTDFKAYLKYLRRSVEVLCTEYGKIGGIWFDGMWNKPEEDWEEDAMYSMIRSHQPDAMIINNTGLSARGALGHIELDSVTFERGRPQPINMADSPKYIASEMCQIFASHWGYAKLDFNFKSMAEIITDFAICRRYGSNFLLNVGPMGDGSIRGLDREMLLTLGEWAAINKEALYIPRPTDISVIDKENDFLLARDDCYYLFCHGLKMRGDSNVALEEKANYTSSFYLPKEPKSITWLDSGEEISYEHTGDRITLNLKPFKYGEDYVVRVAKIEI